MNNKKMSINKPIVSISEMAHMVQLSRARFYQLLESGFFPSPLYHLKSKRPFFNTELQQKILESRQSGIGADGSYLLFYSPRKKERRSHMRRTKVDPQVKELTDALESMGLETTAEQVKQGLAEIFPDGTADENQGVIIRELYRYLKQKMSN